MKPTRRVSTLLALVLAGAIALAGAVAGAIGLAEPALASSRAIAAQSDVDAFTFTSFDGVYTLSTDAEGRSVLTVQETLVAQFPDVDQNRGIRRTLVGTYDGHPTDLQVLSVTDEAGNPRSFEEDNSGDTVDVTIAADNYVYGEQTYVITYRQHNVTKFFADTNADELYWDTNGTDWAQPFGRVTATVVIDPSLIPALNGNAAAAYGYAGSGTNATATETATGFFFEATDLSANQNLSFAIGFEPGTFVPRDSSFFGAPWPLISLLGALGSLVAVAGAFVVRRTKLRDAPGRGIIVPEYLPPKGVSIPLAAVIAKKRPKVTSAQIIGLAVDGYLRVIEVSGRFGKPSYELEFLTTDPAGADAGPDARPNARLAARLGAGNPGPISADELEFLHALFGDELTPGEDRSLKKQDTTAAKKMTTLMTRVAKDAIVDDFLRTLPSGAIGGVVLLAFATGAIAFFFGIASLAQAYGGGIPAITLAVGMLGFLVAIVAVSRRPLEPKGVELRDYLLGLNEYIRLAEADRLTYLQSPQGAERTPVDPTSADQVLKLNERLLPYAILFGLEKQWTAELGRYYEETGTQPGWYSGSSPFNAVIFATGISSLSTSVASSYSASTGGSAGGASSGGGGGGGGGGGV
jgi:uncharacterized membrane protein YgcG